MTINVLWMILASVIGLGIGQSIEPSPATAEPNFPKESNCIINGIVVNPCQGDPDHSNTSGGQLYQ